jgi:hypothetical protein
MYQAVIEGLPATVERSKVLQIAELLGFDPFVVRSVEIGPSDITVNVVVTDGDGATWLSGTDPNEVASVAVRIRIVDGRNAKEALA